MSFANAIKSAFCNYANFKGRATRSEYWWWVLFTAIANSVVSTAVNEDFGSLVTLALLPPTIAVAVRRMHDVSRSGWWVLFPFVNLVFALAASNQEQNQWGPPPPPSVRQHEATPKSKPVHRPVMDEPSIPVVTERSDKQSNSKSQVSGGVASKSSDSNKQSTAKNRTHDFSDSRFFRCDKCGFDRLSSERGRTCPTCARGEKSPTQAPITSRKPDLADTRKVIDMVFTPMDQTKDGFVLLPLEGRSVSPVIEEVLRLLKQTEEGLISGDELASLLGITRSQMRNPESFDAAVEFVGIWLTQLSESHSIAEIRRGIQKSLGRMRSEANYPVFDWTPFDEWWEKRRTP